jgi:hypothetical protein
LLTIVCSPFFFLLNVLVVLFVVTDVTFYRSGIQVFRWYNANKDWLTAARLPRMMKRLLRRANALNPGENDDFADEQPSESVTPAATNAVASAELESKLEQMTLKLGQMAIQLNQTQAQLRQIQQSNRRTEAASSNRIEDLNAIEIRVNASLAAQQERLKIQSNMTEESLRLVISSGEQMANRLSKTEKTLQTIKNNTGNCSCPAVKSPTGKNSPAKTDETIPVDSVKSDEVVMKFQNDMEREIEQLKMKLQLTASDLEKSINSIHVQSEGAMRNFSSVYQEGMKSLASILEDKVSVASTSSYDVITNATLAFGEDLQIL